MHFLSCPVAVLHMAIAGNPQLRLAHVVSSKHHELIPETFEYGGLDYIKIHPRNLHWYKWASRAMKYNARLHNVFKHIIDSTSLASKKRLTGGAEPPTSNAHKRRRYRSQLVGMAEQFSLTHDVPLVSIYIDDRELQVPFDYNPSHAVTHASNEALTALFHACSEALASPTTPRKYTPRPTGKYFHKRSKAWYNKTSQGWCKTSPEKTQLPQSELSGVHVSDGSDGSDDSLAMTAMTAMTAMKADQAGDDSDDQAGADSDDQTGDDGDDQSDDDQAGDPSELAAPPVASEHA